MIFYAKVDKTIIISATEYIAIVMDVFLPVLAVELPVSRLPVLAQLASYRLQITLAAVDSQTVLFCGISLKSAVVGIVIVILRVELGK